jgi:hypothetical protein
MECYPTSYYMRSVKCKRKHRKERSKEERKIRKEVVQGITEWGRPYFGIDKLVIST